MIKAYALNKNGKIELTLEELQKLIDEAVADGKLINSVKETAQERFDKDFNEGVMRGTQLFLEAKEK